MFGHIILIVGHMSRHVTVVPPAGHVVLSWSNAAEVQVIEVEVLLYTVYRTIEVGELHWQIAGIVDDGGV